jgi:hypothetical protein
MAGRMAMRSLARTFELWLAVGKAVKTLRARADKIGGRKTFQRLLDQNGFQSLPAATITRLLRIVDRLAEVGHGTRDWTRSSNVNGRRPRPFSSTARSSRRKNRIRRLPRKSRAGKAQELRQHRRRIPGRRGPSIPNCSRMLRETRAVEVAQFMANVGIRLPDLMKAREYLGYREEDHP